MATPNNIVNVHTADRNAVGVFTTTQSLVTFPGAVAAVTTMWKVLGAVHEPLGATNKVVPSVLALLVGLLIYGTSATSGRKFREKLFEFGIAIINSATVLAAALGIS